LLAAGIILLRAGVYVLSNQLAQVSSGGRYYELDFPGIPDLNRAAVTKYLNVFSLKQV